MADQDTSIKTTKDVRDRLRTLVRERGTTMNDLLEELVTRELTQQEREERARPALEEIRQTTGVTVTVTVTDEARGRAQRFLQELQREDRAA
ncbi:hypothetical protein [Streptomyces sp. TLI_105]|uniref:hypothetical protein n=1 Tax=Streptomyces sp. TLI_105 TaxID=1881019 RepID=UPI00089C5AD9|nr:hypothetical protein [Streptomyces sp. TLI_105]SEB60589.1 hypothetical protein SAMN05428939_0163 [Streptomyces sp. TLI_105]